MAMRRGPLWMIVASICFTLMVALVKIARRELSALDVIAFRAFSSIPLAYALSRGKSLRIKDKKWMLARVSLGCGAMICFFTASKGLSIGNLSVLAKLQPIWLALLAPYLLGQSERAGAKLWAALFGGFVGSAVLVGVGGSLALWPSIYALGASVLAAGAHLAVKKVRQTSSSHAVVYWFQWAALGVSVGALLLTKQRLPHLPRMGLLPVLLGVGVFATLGQLAMTHAYSLDRASRVGAASYATPLMGFAVDWLVFAKWPHLGASVGALLVIASGLWLVVGDRPRARASS